LFTPLNIRENDESEALVGVGLLALSLNSNQQKMQCVTG
jgi:hypothetical protein